MTTIVPKHNNEAIRKAIKYCGSVQKLSNEIGVHRSAVHHWLAGINSPSLESCIKIERVTNKHVMRWEIRKDKEW